MKCISLWQPWATLIAIGAKTIETRSWYWAYRGPLAIHASKGGLSKSEFYETCELSEIKYALAAAGIDPKQMPRGAIVATCNMVDCVRFARPGVMMGEKQAYPMAGQLEQAFGDYTIGRFGFMLRDIVRIEQPIPFVGKQGPFEVPAEAIGK